MKILTKKQLSEVDKLAKYLMKNDLILGTDKKFPTGSGTCEMAIRVIEKLKDKNEKV